MIGVKLSPLLTPSAQHLISIQQPLLLQYAIMNALRVNKVLLLVPLY